MPTIHNRISRRSTTASASTLNHALPKLPHRLVVDYYAERAAAGCRREPEPTPRNGNAATPERVAEIEDLLLQGHSAAKVKRKTGAGEALIDKIAGDLLLAGKLKA